MLPAPPTIPTPTDLDYVQLLKHQIDELERKRDALEHELFQARLNLRFDPVGRWRELEEKLARRQP